MDKKNSKDCQHLFGWASLFDKRFSSTHDQTKKLVEKYKEQGHKIVFTQGSFDMIHIGHARYLEEAKKHGDILVVALDSDEKVRHRKGEHRPVVPQEERLEMLTHLRAVDVVTLKHLQDPHWHLIKLIEPDVLIITERMDYSPEEIDELESICGKVVMLKSQATTSTSARIRLLHVGGADTVVKKISDRFPTLIKDVFEEIKNGKV